MMDSPPPMNNYCNIYLPLINLNLPAENIFFIISYTVINSDKPILIIYLTNKGKMRLKN